nr:MAG TPA: ComA-like protein [Bacteriophage sp.]
MEIKPFKTINGNGYSFREIWKIYDEQFNILRDIILSLGDKYQVENFSGSDNKVITLNTPYNSNQVFVYCNGVLQWKDRDYRENSPTEIELLFDRKATDDVRIVTIKSNVIKNDLHQYLQDISSVVANAKEQYDSARNLESRLVELYSALQQTHSLYTNNSTSSLVTDLTRLKSEYEKVSTSVNSLDKKLKDLIGSSEYILTTLNIDELKGLVKSIKAQIDDLSVEKSLDIVFPVYDAYQPNDYDDGNGDCEIVGVDKSHWFMIDCGLNNDTVYTAIKNSLSRNKIDRLDFILITHYHRDHYGNIVSLCDDKLVKKVYIPDVSKTSFQTGDYSMSVSALQSIDRMIRDACSRNGIPCEVAPNGVVDFHGAELTFYNNSDEDYQFVRDNNISDYNNVSVCLMVKYIGRVAVFEGDVSNIMMWHTAKYVPANIDLLKSHHHAITGMPEIYKKVNPRDVVVTSCRNYMHRIQVVYSYLASLHNLGANIYTLADQIEDIQITYKSKNSSIEYNRHLVRGGYSTQSTNGSIYLDASYTGDLQTGDKLSPFKYLSDVVRYIHQNSQAYFSVIVSAGDYTGIRNINEVESSSTYNGYCLINNLKNEVYFYHRGDGEVIFPSMYFRNCSYLSFDNITFRRSELQKKVYTNIGATSGYYYFNNCKFYNTNTPVGNESTHFNIRDGAVVYLDGTTFGGNVDIGFKCSVNSSATFVGKNIANNVKKVFYTEHGGVINVIHPFNDNSLDVSNPNSTPNLKFNKRSKTVPDVRGASQGQIIEAFNPYNGPQYYISDGNNGWSIVDQYNIHGNLDNKPDFEGQFAYDKTNKRVGFALGSSNKSDWLDLSSNNGIGGVKEWKSGGTYSYGDFISNSQGNLFYYRGGDISYRSGTSVDSQISGDLRVVESQGGRFVNIDPNNHAHTSFAMLHSKPENFELPTTNSEMSKLGMFITYYTKYVFSGQPTKYGQLINIPPGIDNTEEATQIWIEQNSGQMYVRGGNWQDPIASRNFQPVYPDNFNTVDYLFKGVVSSVADARSRNLQLARVIDNYKVVTFYLTPDSSNDFCVSCSFDVSDFKNMLNTLKKSGVPTNCYLLSKHQLWWGLKLNEGTLSSTSIADITWDENCKLVGVTGWPRKFNLD